VMPHAKAVRLSPVKPPACPKGKSWSAGVQACVSTCRDVRDCKKTSGYCVNGMCLCKTGLVMLPDETCALPCDRNECGSDAVCYKNAKGSNTCACNSGYTMTPLGCKEPCTVTKCGANAFCYKNAERNDTCGCNDGFTMTSNGRCIDSCLMQNCGPNATCVKGTGDQAWCICKQGFRNVSGKCIACPKGKLWNVDMQACVSTCKDLKDCKNTTGHCVNGMCSCKPGLVMLPNETCALPCDRNECGSDAVCYKNATGSNTCACNSGYTMTPLGCKEPCTVTKCGANAFCYKNAERNETCGCNDGFTMTSNGRCIDVCDLCGPNATCEMGLQSGAKTCRCNNGYYMLPNNTCAATCIITGCAIGSSCVGDVIEDMYCAENCYLKGCHDTAMCVKDPASGKASCQCSTGLIMQSDGTCQVCGTDSDCPMHAYCSGGVECVCQPDYPWNGTHCTDPCDGVKCRPNAYCNYGQCDCNPDYYMLSNGTCT
ncbi:unnamed protein product, partial [Closterium sp. NIES-65]